jgi:nitrite reductase (NAD(P)H)
LYLNPLEWYTSHEVGILGYHINTLVTEIDTKNRVVFTKNGDCVTYNILVLATGSDALVPRHTPGHDAKGVFVYRTIEDLEKMIEYSQTVKVPDGATKRAAVVGGGLLGLEAAHAVQGLEQFSEVALIERNRWVLSRQLEGEAGGLVVEKVRVMGVDVMLSRRVGKINVDQKTGRITQIVFEDGQIMDAQVLYFAIGIRARDEIARAAGIKCHHRMRK